MRKKKRRLLIISDDHPHNQQCNLCFFSETFEVIVRETADEGLDYARKEACIDVIIVDTDLIDKVALTVLRRIRGMEYHKYTPIVLQGRREDGIEIMKVGKYGVLDILIKPYEKEALGILSKFLNVMSPT